MTLMGRHVPFYKMQGCGNDFIIIDNRLLKIDENHMALWARKLCERAFGVYGDGIFFLDTPLDPAAADYQWHFFNKDGSRASMCGNAARCAGRLAHALNMAPSSHTLLTDVGPVAITVFDDGPNAGLVKVELPPYSQVRLDEKIHIDGKTLTIHSADTGVPHGVIFVDRIESVDIERLGPLIRYHDLFAPAGINVNLVQPLSPDHMLVRTYERGVEAETHACGTGVAAVHLIAVQMGLARHETRYTTSGGEVLTVYFENDRLSLQGPAELTFKGDLFLTPLGLDNTISLD